MDKDRSAVIVAVLIYVALSISLVVTKVNSSDIIQNEELNCFDPASLGATRGK